MEEVKTKNTDGTTTTKKELVNTFDFEKYNDTVTVTSATATTITFTDPDPDHVSPAYDTKGNINPARSSIKNAAPLPLLLLYPQNSSGYNMGDDIRVDGVDEPGWQYPVYDGYHTVYEVNPGKTYSVTKYKAESDWLTEDVDDVDDKQVIAYVYCTEDPGIDAGDEFVVSGITGTATMNGTYTALLDSFYDPAYSLYAVPYRKQISAFSIVTQSSGASLVKNGGTWIAYQPGTSELRYSLKNEPDADSGISKFTYDAAQGDRKNAVTIKTKSRHGLKAGDTVKIVYGQSKDNVDQDTYGGMVQVTAVQDYDSFSYTLIKGKHKKVAPKKDVETTDKSGTVTRVKHGTLTPTTVEEEIDSIRTEVTASGATQVTVYAPGHSFKKGDYVSVNVNNSNYKGVNTNDAPKKVSYASRNYFRYTAGAPVVEGDTSTISQIIYSSDGKTIKFKATKFGSYTARTATATVLEPNKTTGYATFTTSTTHNMVVGQKATISGFVAPTTSTSSSTIRNHTISSLRYDANSKTVLVQFTAAHNLSKVNDVGAAFTVAGANNTAVWPSGTDTYPSVDISWLNATHEIVSIPDTTSITIKYLGQTKNWNVFSGATGIGSPTTVQTATVTQTVYDPQDLTPFNMTAEIAAVPSATKVAFKYPDSADSALASSISLTGLGITISAAAQKGSGAALLEAGDYVYITGLVDSGTNYYSKINGDGYLVKSVASIDATYTYVTIANPVRADGSYIKYADKSSGITGAKMFRGYEVGGTAYLSNSALDSGDSKNSYIITNVNRSSGSNTATITVGTHDLSVGDYVNIEVYADNQDAFSQNGKDCQVTAVTATTFSYTMKANNNIEHISWRDGKATLYFRNSTAGAHNYTVGDVITIASLPSPYTGFNRSGRSVVATGPFSITYALTSAEASRSSKLAKTAVTAGAVTRTTTQSVNKAVYGVVTRVPAIYKKPIAYARTYGEFPNNASIGGLTFSTNDYSTKNQSTSPIYGSELKTVAELLDQYSNGITGFDYRIDVSLATDQNGNKSFNRQFVLIPLYPESLTDYLATLPDGKLAKGQVARPSAFGADKLVFEYPGNISNVSLAEKAENSATRIFVSGSNDKAGSGAETPYAAAADTDLLADNWPLLDKKETVTWPAQSGGSASTTSKTSNTYTDEWGNHDDETDYHASAVRFLSETKPPAGDFVITINGSLTPVVGSYNPGDWCSIIINDNFVKTRLNSVLEPRKDVIVRKIDAIKVDVPNNPAFPENINLTLVADWQVDAVGK